MLVRSADNAIEQSRHGTGKRVILRGGVLPGVTQVAVGTLSTSDAVEPHTHPTMYEIYFVLEGRARYHVGEETYEVGPGDFIVVPPQTVHRQEVLEGPHRIFYWGIAT